jgi:NACHT domain
LTYPSQHQNAPSLRRWGHLWYQLWRGLCLLWSLIIVGVVVNVLSTRITSNKNFPSDSPIGLALRDLPLTIALGIILLLLTILVWVMKNQSSASSSQASSLLPPPSQQSRSILVRTLHQEYTRRLTDSLQGAAMMALRLHERTDITRSSAQLVFRHTAVAGEHALPNGTSIIQAYDETGQGLLILGEPGAGKTTLLLDLGRELLTRAEGDAMHPIPVILNLSSWANKQQPLASWIIDQMQLVYQVPPRFGQSWLEHDQWLLLLDGLDEVEVSARDACIEAINTYHGEHFAPLVVCSRSHEYLTQEERFALPIAIVVQPLQEQQVTDYLKRVGKPLTAVRAALHTNPTLQQLITTPLMLNVIILAYRDKTVKDLPQLGSAEEQQHQIFDRYVQRMLEREIGHFTAQQTWHWLTWLAQQMKRHHLTEFYLENLQPSWLSTKQSRVIYTLLGGLLVGSLRGLLFGLLVGLLGGPLVGLLGGLLGGPLIVLLSWLLVRLPSEREIRPAEVLAWSSSGLWWGLAVGLLGGLLIGLLVGPLSGLLVGLTFGLLIGLIVGLSGKQITEHLRIRPNQGIRSSGWNAFRIGSMIMLIFGLLFGLLYGLPLNALQPHFCNVQWNVLSLSPGDLD